MEGLSCRELSPFLLFSSPKEIATVEPYFLETYFILHGCKRCTNANASVIYYYVSIERLYGHLSCQHGY